MLQHFAKHLSPHTPVRVYLSPWPLEHAEARIQSDPGQRRGLCMMVERSESRHIWDVGGPE